VRNFELEKNLIKENIYQYNYLTN